MSAAPLTAGNLARRWRGRHSGSGGHKSDPWVRFCAQHADGSLEQPETFCYFVSNETMMTTATTTSPDLAGSAIRVGRHLEAELEEVLAAHRLSLQSFFVLGALSLAPDRTLTQKQLVSAAGRTPGTTSVRLNR